jgi:hypothetical protein
MSKATQLNLARLRLGATAASIARRRFSVENPITYRYRTNGAHQ